MYPGESICSCSEEVMLQVLQLQQLSLGLLSRLLD